VTGGDPFAEPKIFDVFDRGRPNLDIPEKKSLSFGGMASALASSLPYSAVAEGL